LFPIIHYDNTPFATFVHFYVVQVDKIRSVNLEEIMGLEQFGIVTQCVTRQNFSVAIQMELCIIIYGMAIKYVIDTDK